MYDGIIDVYEKNELNFSEVAASGVKCIFHRASIGQRIDEAYVERKKVALAQGFLWGAYHLPDCSNLADQLSVFLSVEPGDNEEVAICLDWEDMGDRTLDYKGIRDLVVLFRDRFSTSGSFRYPFIYGGNLLRETPEIASGDALLAQCPLWYVRYKADPDGIPTATWPTYTLWQFDNENRANGAPNPSVLAGADWNRFDGSVAELETAWKQFGRVQK